MCFPIYFFTEYCLVAAPLKIKNIKTFIKTNIKILKTFGCDFYNQNMIHLTENHFEEMFKARSITLIHTKHDINP